MAYSVTLDTYTPSARNADAGPWTQVRWQQAGDNRRGPWTNLETQALDVGTDPTAPTPVENVTTELATVYPGWFRLVALDADSVEEPTAPFYAGSATRPTVQEVANLMPDRTTVDGGDEARTFNEDTSPTSEEVEGLIDMVLDSVDPRVPPGANAVVERAARHVVTLSTAILVESGNWGDQLEANEARVALWERLLALNEATLAAATTPAVAPDPSAFSIVTPTDTQDLIGRVGRVSPTCWDWTDL